MNSITKKLLDSFDDYAVEQLDIELAAINTRIDNKIKKGASYKKEASEHRKIVNLRKDVMMGA